MFFSRPADLTASALAMQQGGSDGSVWTWGWGGNGELGPGTSESCSYSGATLACRRAPTSVGGLSGATAAAAGNEHSLALTGRSRAVSYAYDRLDRLTGATAPEQATSYSYDPVGNRLSCVPGAAAVTRVCSLLKVMDWLRERPRRTAAG